MLKAGTPERGGMEMSSHKTRSAFGRCARVNEEDLKSSYDRLSNAHGRTKAETERARPGTAAGSLDASENAREGI